MADGELMKQIAKGNSRAFQVLFQRHKGLVLGYGRRIVGDSTLSEDVSQEVWIRVVRAAGNYQDQGTFRSWLLRIVRNCSLTMLEQRRGNLTADAEVLENSPSQEDFEQIFSRQQEVKKIQALIDELPDNQRVAMVMWLTEDVSYNDVASAIGVTEGAVKSLIFRARQTLETRLKGVS